MLTDKQVKKFSPILNNFISGNQYEFSKSIYKLTKLELMLIIAETHQVVSIGKHKKLELIDKIIDVLEYKHR
jgi:hypothetical protein